MILYCQDVIVHPAQVMKVEIQIRILSTKCCAKVVGYFRRTEGVNPLVTLLLQIGNQLALESYLDH